MLEYRTSYNAAEGLWCCKVFLSGAELQKFASSGETVERALQLAKDAYQAENNGD